MGQEIRTTEIGPYTYAVTQLDANKARPVFVRLMNILARAGRMADNPAAAIGELLATLKDEDLKYFCEEFGKLSTVTGGEYEDKTPYLTGLCFGSHFAGQFGRMFDWLVFAILSNFQSFFDDLPGLLAKYAPKGEAKAEEKAPS